MSDNYTYKARSAWEAYAGAKEEMRAFAAEYLDFLSACKTEREVVAWAAERLAAAGHREIFEDNNLIMRNLRGKCLFAARRGKNTAGGLNLIAAHADSPRLDFKQHPFLEEAGIAQAKTHYYGGLRKYQWLARPLAIHGVAIRADGSPVAVNIGDGPGDPVFCIADLLPHLAQKQSSQKLSEAFEGEKLNIVVGHEPLKMEGGEKDEGKDAVKNMLLTCLHNKYGLVEEDFITAELEVVPQGRASFVGFDESLLGGYGHDDRICVFAALRALLAASPEREPERSMGLIIWDKEEIGSDGATGASSRFLQYCIEDMVDAWAPGQKASHVFLRSRAISADVTAALDPDYQDVHEKRNAAMAGFGPCFSKFTGSRGKYGASEADAEFFAQMRGLLNSAGIPWQAAELGKVDLGGGGTVALFLAALGISVIDLGPALLSMHSPFELASQADLYATWQAYKAFLEN